MAKTRSVSTLYLTLTLSLSTLIVIMVGTTMIMINTQHYNEMVEQVTERVHHHLRESMVSQVERSVNLIQQMHEDSELRLRNRLSKQIREAHKQALQLLGKNADLPLRIQKEIIIDALRPIRFNFGSSGILVTDIYGELQLNPSDISYEGLSLQVLKKEKPESDDHFQRLLNVISQTKKAGELYTDNHRIVDSNREHSDPNTAIGFYKYLEPLDWIIGTHESLYEFEKGLLSNICG